MISQVGSIKQMQQKTLIHSNVSSYETVNTKKTSIKVH